MVCGLKIYIEVKNFWSPTGRGVSGGSGGARKSRVMVFDSAHQAKLMGLSVKILPPSGTYFYYNKTPPKKQQNFEQQKIEIAIL